MSEELQNNEFMELDEEFIVLAIPDDTVEIDITAKVYVNHELQTVTKHMDFPEVRAAIREARSGYIPGDALFMLAPTSQEKMKNLLEKYLPEGNE